MTGPNPSQHLRKAEESAETVSNDDT